MTLNVPVARYLLRRGSKRRVLTATNKPPRLPFAWADATSWKRSPLRGRGMGMIARNGYYLEARDAGSVGSGQKITLMAPEPVGTGH
jgi:hypothetical protein